MPDFVNRRSWKQKDFKISFSCGSESIRALAVGIRMQYFPFWKVCLCLTMPSRVHPYVKWIKSCVCVYMYTYVYTHIHMYMSMSNYAFKSASVCQVNEIVCMCIYVHICIYTHTYVYVHTSVYICVHILRWNLLGSFTGVHPVYQVERWGAGVETHFQEISWNLRPVVNGT